MVLVQCQLYGKIPCASVPCPKPMRSLLTLLDPVCPLNLVPHTVTLPSGLGTAGTAKPWSPLVPSGSLWLLDLPVVRIMLNNPLARPMTQAARVPQPRRLYSSSSAASQGITSATSRSLIMWRPVRPRVASNPPVSAWLVFRPLLAILSAILWFQKAPVRCTDDARGLVSSGNIILLPTFSFSRSYCLPPARASPMFEAIGSASISPGCLPFLLPSRVR